MDQRTAKRKQSALIFFRLPVMINSIIEVDVTCEEQCNLYMGSGGLYTSLLVCMRQIELTRFLLWWVLYAEQRGLFSNQPDFGWYPYAGHDPY